MSAPTHIWFYDGNRRVYRALEPGKTYATGGPIYRESWRKLAVIGETSRSWLTEFGHKVPKKGERRGYALTDSEMEDFVFIHDNAYKIGRFVEDIKDADLLRKIATLSGYIEK